jgi:hypothetical protein
MLELLQLHVSTANTFDRFRLNFTHTIVRKNNHWNRIDTS